MKKALVILLMLAFMVSCDFLESDSNNQIVNVKVDGHAYRLKASEGFYKFVQPNADDVVMNIWRAEKSHPQIWIYLPADVKKGKVYTQADYKDNFDGFSVFYSSPDDEGYEVNFDYPFTLEVTEWDGIGGKAEGVFSGILKQRFSDLNRLVELKDGKFEATITDKIKRP